MAQRDNARYGSARDRRGRGRVRTGAIAALVAALALPASPALAAAPPRGLPVVPDATGTVTGQPYAPQTVNGSELYRIPALITLSNGWLLASADSEYNYTPDSPANIDNSVSISKDGGKTWEWTLVNHFVDRADTSADAAHGAKTTNSPERDSASFIDPALAQGSDGTVYLLIDAVPANTGFAYGGRAKTGVGTGLTDDGNPRVGKARSLQESTYTHYIDRHDPHTVPCADGTGDVVLYPVKDASGAVADSSWADGDYNLWTVTGGVASKIMTVQDDTNKAIQDNAFYKDAEWQLFPTCYVCLRRGTVTAGGIDWGPMELLDVKENNESFCGVCPGRGTEIDCNGAKRMVFQVYDVRTGTERASCIYTDDGGDTWHRGSHHQTLGESGKTSESQTVQLPDGRLRMYSRNGGAGGLGKPGYISYSDSSDGGRTWGPVLLDRNLKYCGNCQVSFVNMNGTLVGPDGARHENLVVASYPKGDGTKENRLNGVLRVGSMAQDGTVTWLNSDDIRWPGGYYYSCLAPSGDKVHILYERDSDNPAVIANGELTGKIVFETLAVTDLLGEGWSWEAPVAPSDGVFELKATDVGEFLRNMGRNDGTVGPLTFSPAAIGLVTAPAGPWSYSIDGGTSWHEVEGTTARLTPAEALSINEDAGVKVRFSGSDTVYVMAVDIDELPWLPASAAAQKDIRLAELTTSLRALGRR